MQQSRDHILQNKGIISAIYGGFSGVFSKEIYCRSVIRASAETVWDVLTEFEAYPTWNPYIRSAKGSLLVGQKLEIRTKPPGSRELGFHAYVLAVDSARELRWRGSSLPKYLFAGEHSFLIHERTNCYVDFIQKEIFTGLLTPLLKRALDKRTSVGFYLMNEALKVRAEARGRGF